MMNYGIALFLLLTGISINACSQSKNELIVKTTTEVFKMISKNDTKQLSAWINSGGNLEEKNAKGETLLMAATYQNNIEAAKLLIDAGANVNAQDQMLNSPFLYAGASGYLAILKMCKAKADYGVYNRYGGTALIPACERGHVEIVKELLKDKSFPKDHVNKLGWTGLLEAIILSNGGPAHVEIVQLLVDAGCDVNLADNDGITPLAHAKQRGYKEIITILQKAGAK